MYKFPKISVVTPSFNQGPFIEATILSVIEQAYPNLEFIVIDGGSTDNTIEILKKYDKHIHFWVSEKDKGQSHAINKGFQKCSGEIVCWLNSDDLFEPGSLFKVAEAFMSSKAEVVVGRCAMFSDISGKELLLDSGQVSFYSLLRFWRNHFCPPQPSIFFKQVLLERVGFLNEELHYGMDLDLWLRMAYNSRFHSIPEVLARYRVHDQSKTGSENGFGKFQTEWIRIIQKNFKKLPLHKKIRFHIEMRIATLTKKVLTEEEPLSKLA